MVLGRNEEITCESFLSVPCGLFVRPVRTRRPSLTDYIDSLRYRIVILRKNLWALLYSLPYGADLSIPLCQVNVQHQRQSGKDIPEYWI